MTGALVAAQEIWGIEPGVGRLKTFRFGVNVGPSRSRAEWAEKARKLEDLGYATLTVPDHLTDFFAPMPALISAAEATKNLRVGTNVLNNDKKSRSTALSADPAKNLILFSYLESQGAHANLP